MNVSGLSLSFESTVNCSLLKTCYFVGEFYQQQANLPAASRENQVFLSITVKCYELS